MEKQLEKALKLAEKAHKGQVDKAGKDYYDAHIMTVVNSVDTTDEKTVAALHDIVEDTDVSLMDLIDEGFRYEIVDAVSDMTHDTKESYFEYIERIKLNPLATAVKKADLKNNMDLSRIDNPTEKAYARIEKYKKACAILTGETLEDIEDAAKISETDESGAKRSEQLIASVMGFAIGDALGVPFECRDRELATIMAIDMIGFRCHRMPKGTWSDDTSMVLATMDSITKLRRIDYDDIMRCFIKWYKKGEYTATGIVFDIGYTTKKSIDRYIDGKKYDKCGSTSFYENGNGSLMRMLPLAIYLSVNEVSEQKEAEYVYYLSSLTHANEVSLMACMLYCDLFKILLENGCSIRDALDLLQEKDYEKYYEDSVICYQRILDGSILNMGIDQIKSSGYVVDTLESVVWCLANTNNYKDAVLQAVNLGGDADTIAAITGSLAVIMYGEDSIPYEWKTILRRSGMIEEIGEKYLSTLLEICGKDNNKNTNYL